MGIYKLVSLGFLFTLTLNVNATEVAVPADSDLLKLNTSEPIPDCYFCTLPKTQNNKDIGKLCGNDPFAVVCANAIKENDDLRDQSAAIADAISAAEKKALAPMGYNSMEAAIADSLNKKGIQLDSKNLKIKRELLQGDTHSIGNDSSVFQPTAQCKKDQSVFSFDSYISSSATPEEKTVRLNELTGSLRNLRGQIKAYEEKRGELMGMDPLVTYQILVSNCEKTKKPKDYNNKLDKGSSMYRKLLGDCQNLSSIQNEATDLFRTQSSSLTYKKKGLDFFRRFSYSSYLSEESYSGKTQGMDGDLERTKFNIENEKRRWIMICNELDSYTKDVGASTINDTIIKVHTNKIFIDSLTSAIYPADKIQKFEVTTQAAQRAVRDSLGSILPGLTNRSAIENVAMGIYTNVPRPISSSHFVNEGGQLYLDPLSLSEGKLDDDYYSGFFDPQLSGLRYLNAYYMPQVGARPSSMTSVGSMFGLAMDNPYGAFMVFAHETGHSIDAGDSNDLSLTSQYSSVLKCFMAKDSIGMNASQRRETTADFVAANALASELGKLPEADRKSAYIEAVKPFCAFASPNYAFHGDGVHPDERLRINGIFTANPQIRRAIGCANENYSYRICPQ